MSDFIVHDHGTVALLVPQNHAAKEWIDEHVQVESWQWFAGGIACEPRMIEDIITGIVGDGLEVTLK
jgi:hypothetical protein